jgi:hypothetical protein
MNYLLVSDILWYSGHIITALSIVFTHTHLDISIALVFIGQSITIISRPIGRIGTKEQKVAIIYEEAPVKQIDSV